METLKQYRQFLTADAWDRLGEFESDQKKQIPPPLPQKPYPEDAILIDLIAPENFTIGTTPLIETIKLRRSRRKFTSDPLNLQELSFLLWATQGVSKVFHNNLATLRTVPSGGARHPFETYLFVNHDRVIELETGLYRYLALEHKLYLFNGETGLDQKVTEACRPGQVWARNCAVMFIWTAIPYRTEWRYTIAAPKIIAQDSGHLCQNLYLASVAIGAGTCAIGAYDQAKMDKVLDVDGEKEFAIYVAPVGKVKNLT